VAFIFYEQTKRSFHLSQCYQLVVLCCIIYSLLNSFFRLKSYLTESTVPITIKLQMEFSATQYTASSRRSFPYKHHMFQTKRVNINLFTSIRKVHVTGYLSWYSDSVRAGRSDDGIPERVRISATVPTGTGAHTASCTMGTGSLARGKAAGARC
jgi:hypothetical protein